MNEDVKSNTPPKNKKYETNLDLFRKLIDRLEKEKRFMVKSVTPMAVGFDSINFKVIYYVSPTFEEVIEYYLITRNEKI